MFLGLLKGKSDNCASCNQHFTARYTYFWIACSGMVLLKVFEPNRWFAQEFMRSCKITIGGDAGVGKTTMCFAYSGNPCDDRYTPRYEDSKLE